MNQVITCRKYVEPKLGAVYHALAGLIQYEMGAKFANSGRALWRKGIDDEGKLVYDFHWESVEDDYSANAWLAHAEFQKRKLQICIAFTLYLENLQGAAGIDLEDFMSSEAYLANVPQNKSLILLEWVEEGEEYGYSSKA